jgi:hypothetical protein
MAHFMTFCDPKSLLLTTPVYACLQPFCPLWRVAALRFRVIKRGFGDGWGHLGRHQGRQDGGAWSHRDRLLPAARAPFARPACPPIQRPGEQRPGEHQRRGDHLRRVELRGVSPAGARPENGEQRRAGGDLDGARISPRGAVARIADRDYYERWMRRMPHSECYRRMSVCFGKGGGTPQPRRDVEIPTRCRSALDAAGRCPVRRMPIRGRSDRRDASPGGLLGASAWRPFPFSLAGSR